MKKMILMMMMAVAGCTSSPYGQGGENACQFVKEQVPGLRDNIAKMEVIAEDSLLSDIALAFSRGSFAQAGVDFLEGNISRENYQKIIDERAQLLQDIQDSWQFSMVVNDSLRRLSKYDDMWRKVYKVLVTMKSGDTKEPRVLMDNDGITPRMLEMDFGRQLEDYQRDILQANDDCILKR